MMKIKWVTAAVCVFAAALFAVGITYRSDEVFTNEDFIRFHVIANSDSDEDQALKLKVRDRLVKTIDDGLVREAVAKSDGSEGESGLSIGESRDYILENLDKIEAEAYQVIEEEGFDYPVTAEMCVCWIPEKTYGSVTFPAGNYEALRIMIGEAEGQNWWCVLYPPLCLIDSEHNSYEADEVLRDSVIHGKYDKLEKAAHSDSSSTVLKLRFKTLDAVKKITKSSED